ncbi:MAG: hypothetical protein IJV34_01885 [Prevotella sp.]|nr:hypothetical protein [Prevotella sp.]
MKKIFLLMAVAVSSMVINAQLPMATFQGQRGMWASVCGNSEVSTSGNAYLNDIGKLLISWRMLPTDTWDTSFHLYSRAASQPDGSLGRKAYNIKDATCCQLTLPTSSTVYYLVRGDFFAGTPPFAVSKAADKQALREAALDSVVIDERLWKDKLPYITIPLVSTDDCSDYPNEFKYQANDCSVGDLDGDGVMEVVVKRLLTYYDANGNVTGTSEGAGDSDKRAKHIAIFDAYKLDGTFLWRVKSGPNIIAGNSINFAVADLDGDGCAEVVTKTGEGTVFGDGKEIPDTDGDGKTDYRDIWPSGHYTGDGSKGYGGPEFFSVIDGKTGRELARNNFICRGVEGQTPAELAANWYENDWKWDPREKKYYWKLANSLRLGVASFKGKGLQVFLGRGVYGRTVVEAWEFLRTPDADRGLECSLSRMWKLDTDTPGGRDTNKDGNYNSYYAGQGNHAFNVADLDGDGKDEVMYGSCAWDDDGTGLWTTRLGHGDANHVGKFLPDREGMQVFHCLENGKTQVALHDAKDGSLIWKKDGTSDNDMGRCMTADVDPSSPGYEFWMYGNELFDQNGTEMYKDGNRKKESSANAGIWFDGYLNRQMINEGIVQSFSHGRTFTIYRYDISFNNSSKSNPGWYGDMLGDWREEFIVPDGSKLKNIKIFSTWYPTQYKLPYLMSDHTYYMQCIHEQVGYNQPTNIGGYYLGSDMDFSKVPLMSEEEFIATEIQDTKSEQQQVQTNNTYYDLSGRAVKNPSTGLYIRNGKKIFVKENR